jgi:hypothetical protein
MNIQQEICAKKSQTAMLLWADCFSQLMRMSLSVLHKSVVNYFLPQNNEMLNVLINSHRVIQSDAVVEP